MLDPNQPHHSARRALKRAKAQPNFRVLGITQWCQSSLDSKILERHGIEAAPETRRSKSWPIRSKASSLSTSPERKQAADTYYW